MKADVYFSAAEVDPQALADTTVVVIDVVRATTCIVEALALGARSIFPVTSAEDAVRLAASLGREDTILCGERKGIMIEGFDLGNSPREFTADIVAGRRLVMSTTNGTGALVRAQEAVRVVACAFTNLSAVADATRDEARLIVLCAGRQGRFSLDDAVCAGHLLRRLGADDAKAMEMNDAGWATVSLASAMTPMEALAQTGAGAALKEIGLEADLEVCGDVDRHAVVPEMVDQSLAVRED